MNRLIVLALAVALVTAAAVAATIGSAAPSGGAIQAKLPPKPKLPPLPGAVDWPDAPGLRLWNRAGKLAHAIAGPRDFVARRKVDAALRLLGRGRRVTTDRLHAMILASAVGRRVVAVDNSTGKVL